MDGDLVACPYNKSHLVAPLRMPQHLLKCKKNYTGESLATCEYNALHLIPFDEMDEHYKKCIDYKRKVMKEGNDEFVDNMHVTNA